MNDSTNVPLLALGLSGAHLLALAGDPDLTARLDHRSIAFSVAGLDRIDGTVPTGQSTLDASAAVIMLVNRTRSAAFLVAAAPQRDHPYNLARRVASLGHLSHERTGLIVGTADSFAPGPPPGVQATRDAVVAVRKLTQSWPYESIVGDRETKIFVRSDQILHVDHEGVFDIAGPLNVPSPPGGSPVTAWYASSADEVTAAVGTADVVVLSPSDAAAQAVTGRALVFVTLEATADVARVAAQAGVDGMLLRPGVEPAALAHVLDSVIPELEARGLVRPAGTGPLRQRLGLARAADLLAGARPAFPVPKPQVTR